MFKKVALLASAAFAQEGVTCGTVASPPWGSETYAPADAEACKTQGATDIANGNLDACVVAEVDEEAGTVNCEIWYYAGTGADDIREWATDTPAGLTTYAWFFDGVTNDWRADIDPLPVEEEEEEEEDEEALSTKIAASGLAALAAVMMAF